MQFFDELILHTKPVKISPKIADDARRWTVSTMLGAGPTAVTGVADRYGAVYRQSMERL